MLSSEFMQDVLKSMQDVLEVHGRCLGSTWMLSRESMHDVLEVHG